MLLDVMWALYWIDVLSDFPALIFIPLLTLFLSALFTSLYNSEVCRDNRKTITWVWWRVIPISILVALLVMLVPSKETMYVMLGVKTTDTVVNSATGQRFQKAVNAKMDEYLKKLEGTK